MISTLLITPTNETLNFLACAITSSGLFPALVIATTENNSGLLSITSKA